MKVLNLTIARAYFDAILQGEKKEEFRQASPYWLKRLKHEADHRRPLTYTHVTFRNGYAQNSPSLKVELEDIELMNLTVEKGRKEKFFVIFLGKLVGTEHLKPDQTRLLRLHRA